MATTQAGYFSDHLMLRDRERIVARDAVRRLRA
jgi:hypothetical protein